MKVLIPATTANLGPGFDLLGASLNIDNEIEAEFSESYSLIEEGYTEQKPFQEHLIAQIMVSLFKEFGITKPFALKTLNRIPFARGMGSSAAAIVGALLLANQMSKANLTNEDLLHRAIAIEGHPDNVAPALLGGVILTTKNKFFKLPPPQVEACLLIPEYKLETKKARAVLPKTIPLEIAVLNSAKLAQLVLALERGDGELFLESLADQLHEPYRGDLIPGFKMLRKKAEELGGKLIISGAGPALLYLKKKQAKPDAKLLTQIWSLPNEVLEVKIGANGALIAL